MKKPLRLSRSQVCALLCYSGVEMPLWAACHWTVASVRVLHKQGFMDEKGVTRKGKQLAQQIAARNNEISTRSRLRRRTT